MTTDEERRRIAQGLRIHGADWCGMGWRYRLPFLDGGVYMCCDGGDNELKDAANQLADLIEPSCDRDALLALADSITDMRAYPHDDSMRQVVQMSYQALNYIASRIREACGEAS